MSIKSEVAKLQFIKNPDEFSYSVENIINNSIKKNPNSEIRMIKSFRNELNSLVETLLKENKRVIESKNYRILPTEFTFLFSLQKTVDLSLSLIEEKEEYMKMVCHQSTLPKYVTDTLRDQTKNLFYMLVSSKLKELKNTELASIQDCFKDEKEIKGFIENEYIQKAIDRVGTKINIINSTYYTKPCTTDSFPTLHTIFLTGVSNRISKEESFLIPIGIMIYNDLTNFGQTDIRSLRFSETIKSEMPVEVFAQVFAFYILLKMDISEKHRFFDNLHLFDSEKLKSDLIFVQHVLNQTPNNSKLAVRI